MLETLKPRQSQLEDQRLRPSVDTKHGSFMERSGLASEKKGSSRIDQSDFYFKQREFPSEVGQSGNGGAQKATARTEAGSAEATTYRGRITGPVQFVNKLLATWHLPPESACVLLGFEPSRLTYVNDVLQGYETLTGRDAKDRIAHLFQIRRLLSALFRDEAVENEWLREPHDTLNGKVPMDLLREGSMENLLLVREYVELVTGR